MEKKREESLFYAQIRGPELHTNSLLYVILRSPLKATEFKTPCLEKKKKHRRRKETLEK